MTDTHVLEGSCSIKIVAPIHASINKKVTFFSLKENRDHFKKILQGQNPKLS